ncbi:hypothetical protein M231_01201 [Tremella mesenterica]|uniref:Uncharacterized protein n=1 Tax=Tremella mesenterica TaxID=5217 RepID=A0A4Q1BTS9_TREME|nr:hypothetical protein M231_01201 [Tremella mesenterica]
MQKRTWGGQYPTESGENATKASVSTPPLPAIEEVETPHPMTINSPPKVTPTGKRTKHGKKRRPESDGQSEPCSSQGPLATGGRDHGEGEPKVVKEEEHSQVTLELGLEQLISSSHTQPFEQGQGTTALVPLNDSSRVDEAITRAPGSQRSQLPCSQGEEVGSSTPPHPHVVSGGRKSTHRPGRRRRKNGVEEPTTESAPPVRTTQIDSGSCVVTKTLTGFSPPNITTITGQQRTSDTETDDPGDIAAVCNPGRDPMTQNHVASFKTGDGEVCPQPLTHAELPGYSSTAFAQLMELERALGETLGSGDVQALAASKAD